MNDGLSRLGGIPNRLAQEKSPYLMQYAYPRGLAPMG
jgi:hypothetical protein